MLNARTSSGTGRRQRLRTIMVRLIALLIAIAFAVTVGAASPHYDQGGHTVGFGGSSSENGAGQGVHRVGTDEPVIFITIDDGIHPSREALDIVRAHEIPVSLFLNEDPVEYNHSYFAEYISLGNHVHSHTLSHPDLTRLDTSAQGREICGMVDTLNEHYGDTQHVGSLLRAPYGASNENTATAAQHCGLDTIIYWSATAENGQVTLATGTELQPGDIVLTHFTEDLPENLTRIRQRADDAGLRIARLEDHL